MPLKLATHGPVFRYERPQKGRYRQFHQIDAEIIGAAEPQADVELLVMADQLLHELGIAEGVTLQLNTLGDAETRDAWRAALVAHFDKHRGELSEDSLVRLDKNPLRILDSKDPRDRPIADAAPGIDAHMSSEAGAFFEAVTKGLDAAGVAWTRNARLVRGLDYYRHTAFEFVTDRLGAQGTVLAGGRYDGLIEALGGPMTPAVGWAAGIERLAMLIDEPAAATIDVAVVPMGAAGEAAAGGVIATLRRAGVACDMAYKGNMKKRMQKADAAGARFVGDPRRGRARARRGLGEAAGDRRAGGGAAGSAGGLGEHRDGRLMVSITSERIAADRGAARRAAGDDGDAAICRPTSSSGCRKDYAELEPVARGRRRGAPAARRARRAEPR